uniref:Uncharacterized protein n=1 Tax=Arion vulgaris TaxID=1028688 RepID=A0A0B7AZ36_9EUPU
MMRQVSQDGIASWSKVLFDQCSKHKQPTMNLISSSTAVVGNSFPCARVYVNIHQILLTNKL